MHVCDIYIFKLKTDEVNPESESEFSKIKMHVFYKLLQPNIQYMINVGLRWSFYFCHSFSLSSIWLSLMTETSPDILVCIKWVFQMQGSITLVGQTLLTFIVFAVNNYGHKFLVPPEE